MLFIIFWVDMIFSKTRERCVSRSVHCNTYRIWNTSCATSVLLPPAPRRHTQICRIWGTWGFPQAWKAFWLAGITFLTCNETLHTLLDLEKGLMFSRHCQNYGLLEISPCSIFLYTRTGTLQPTGGPSLCTYVSKVGGGGIELKTPLLQTRQLIEVLL
jgi:hypothetical protein